MHFFIDTNNLQPQIATDAFGAVSSSIYNVTSKFSNLGSSTKAFAPVKGQIVVQQSTNPALVNIILKPSKAVKGIPVKYFVFRGIEKNSFIQNTDNIVPTGSEAIQKLWTDFATWVSKLDTAPPTPKVDILGYDLNIIADTESIRSVFMNAHDVRAFVVHEGMWIGNFAANAAGFEIILAESDYLPTIGYSRATNYAIDTNTLSGFEEKKKREEILNFIDPAAFYGLFYKKGVKINGTNTKVKTDQLYTDVLSKFHTKNTIYLDIRNEEGYSYNFFDNYFDGSNNNIELSVNGSGFSPMNYENNSWPILAIDSAVTTNNTATDIAIKLRTDDNPEPLIYHTDIVNTPSQKGGLFIGTDAIMSVGAAWTKQLLFQAFNQQNGGSFQNIATYNRINFYRQTPYTGSNPKVPVKTEFHHNLFGSINHPEINQVNHFTKQVDLGFGKLVNGSLDSKTFAQTVKRTVTWDDEVIVFQGVKHNSADQTKSYLSPFIKTKPHSFRSSIFINNEAKVFNKQHFKRVIIDEGNEAIKLFRLTNTNQFDNDIEYQTTLGITQAELSTLKTYTGLDTNSNIYINLERIIPTGGGTTFINSFNVEYSKFNLKIVGFDTLGNTVPATIVGNPIVVYSNDYINFFSKDFTELRGVGLLIFNPTNALIEENFIFTNNDRTLTPPRLNQFMRAFQNDLNNNYGLAGLTFRGNPVGLSPLCTFITQATSILSPPANGFTNVFVTVNPNNLNDNTAFAIPGTPNRITLFTPNWNFVQGHFNNTVAHEFGHLYGLEDRYIDGGTFDAFSDGRNFSRMTIPLRMPRLIRGNNDPNYNYSANLYSVRQIGGLTSFQVDVLFGRRPNEYVYNNGIAFFAFNSEHTDAFNEVFNMISGGQFDGIEINDDKKTKFQFLFQGNLLNSQQVQNFIDLNRNPFDDFYDFVKDGWIGIMPYFDRNYGNTKLLKAKTFSPLSRNRSIRPAHRGMCRFFRDLDGSWVRNNPQGNIIINQRTDW